MGFGIKDGTRTNFLQISYSILYFCFDQGVPTDKQHQISCMIFILFVLFFVLFTSWSIIKYALFWAQHVYIFPVWFKQRDTYSVLTTIHLRTRMYSNGTKNVLCCQRATAFKELNGDNSVEIKFPVYFPRSLLQVDLLSSSLRQMLGLCLFVLFLILFLLLSLLLKLLCT